MSVELGSRLAQMRKQAGYSQEGVADKLGVSRQAVSRWENGEASPDTDNLIALADLYNVSLDELVGKAKPGETVDQHLAEEGEGFQQEKKEEVDEEDEDRGGSRALSHAFWGTFSLLCIVAYLVMGFAWKTETGAPIGWASGWVVLLLNPVLRSLVYAFRKGKMRYFQIAPLVVGVYVGMGIIGNFYGQNYWHPYWIEFFAIPLYYTVAGFVDSFASKR